MRVWVVLDPKTNNVYNIYDNAVAASEDFLENKCRVVTARVESKYTGPQHV